MQYPKRKDHLALDGLNLCIAGGQVNAITGSSGGGKSSEPVMTGSSKDAIAKSISIQQYLHCYSVSMIILMAQSQLEVLICRGFPWKHFDQILQLSRKTLCYLKATSDSTCV